MMAARSPDNTENNMDEPTFAELDSFFYLIVERLNNIQDIEMHFASKIFIDRNCNLTQESNVTVKKFFGSLIEKLDFNKARAAVNIMNKWCAIITKNRITNVFTPIDVITAPVIIFNAVYFNGVFRHPFSSKYTRLAPFYMNENTIIDVQTIFHNDFYNCGSLPAKFNAEYIELPYKDENLSMIIIVPKGYNGLTRIERHLDTLDFAQLCGLPTMERDLYLPKFKVESTYHIKTNLNDIGLVNVFECTRNKSAELFSMLLQSIIVEVNEVNVETAHQGFDEADDSGPLPPCFCVDRPFSYTIFDRITQTIIFQGHIQQPQIG